MKQLTITEEAKQLLFDEKRLGETYSDTIIRVMTDYSNCRILLRSES